MKVAGVLRQADAILIEIAHDRGTAWERSHFAPCGSTYGGPLDGYRFWIDPRWTDGYARTNGRWVWCSILRRQAERGLSPRQLERQRQLHPLDGCP